MGAGEIGIIELSWKNVFQGYWKTPEKMVEELRDRGFFITGDLGVKPQDGRISVVGRQKDLMISGGYNYPKEMEDVLTDMDGVLESAVFGVPHPDFGEFVIAAVILEPGAPLNSAAIASVVEPKLARFKHPRHYIITDALPRNTMGKVQKNVLRAEYGG